MQAVSFKRHWFPPDVIREATLLCCRWRDASRLTDLYPANSVQTRDRLSGERVPNNFELYRDGGTRAEYRQDPLRAFRNR